jgi:hypothetical protein
VWTVGFPFEYWIIGGENQYPRPLYQSTALLNVLASDASMDPIYNQPDPSRATYSIAMITSTKTDYAHFAPDFSFPSVPSTCSSKGHLQSHFDTRTTVIREKYPVCPVIPDSLFQLLGQF